MAAQVAGDDLALPFAVGALLRAVGLGILGAFAFSFAADISCPTVTCPWLVLPGAGCIVGYIVLSIALMAVTALLEAGIAMSSSKGAIMLDSPRHALPSLLAVHSLVNVVELLLAFWAALSFWSDNLECHGVSPHEEQEAVEMLGAIVWLQVFAISTMVLGVVFTFDLSGSVDVNDIAWLNRRWQTRCKLLCCFAPQDSSTEIALRSLVQTISSIFAGLDLVPSDGLAAMLLLALLPPGHHVSAPRSSEVPGRPAPGSRALVEETEDGAADAGVADAGAHEPGLDDTGAIQESHRPRNHSNPAPAQHCAASSRRSRVKLDTDEDVQQRLRRASIFAPYCSASYGWWLQTWRSCLFCKGALRQVRACARCQSPPFIARARAHTHTHIHTHTHTHTHTRAHTHTHTHARSLIHTHACTHTHTHACMHARTFGVNLGRDLGGYQPDTLYQARACASRNIRSG